MGLALTSSHLVSAAPSSSQGGLLTLCPCSSVGSLPRETVLHELLQREAFPRAAVLHKLLQRGGSQLLPANLLHRGLLSPRGHRPCQEPAPAGASHRATASFGHIRLLRPGLLHGLQVDICSTVDLCGLQGDLWAALTLPSHGCSCPLTVHYSWPSPAFLNCPSPVCPSQL